MATAGNRTNLFRRRSGGFEILLFVLGVASLLALAYFGMPNDSLGMILLLLTTVMLAALVWNRVTIRRLRATILDHRKTESMAGLGFWRWDISTGDVTWSDQVYRIFKLDPDTFSPNIDSILALSPWPEENKRDRELIERAMEDRETGTYEQRFLYPDGKTGYYRSTFRGVYKDDGELAEIRGTVQDITEQKVLELELSSVYSAIENSLNAFDIVDQEGKFVYVNKAYVQMWGYDSADEILGTSPVGHCADPETPSRIIETLNKEGRCIIEFLARRKDGSSFDVLMYARLDYDHHGNAIYPSTSIDVSDQKRNEAELRAYREKLENLVEERTAELRAAQASLLEQERMATLGQVSATVSHELRNPLGTIQASLYLIAARSAGKNLNIERSMERAQRNIDRCVRISDELLAYTQCRIVELETTDMGAWLPEVFEGLEVPAGIRVHKDLQGVCVTQIDRDKFSQCVQNVWKNACESLADLEGHRNEGVTAEIRVRTKLFGNRFELHISDNGRGIDREHREKVFEALFTTKSFGVGLGLTMAADMLSAMGGGISIDNDIGRGATVVLWVPVVSGQT